MDLGGEQASGIAPDASSTLAAIRNANQRGIYLLLDFHPYLQYATTQRMLRDILQRGDGQQPHVIVMVVAKVELPNEL